MIIGVLALQGAYIEHVKHLEKLIDVKARLVKLPADLIDLDGIILPGGESTVMGKLLRKNGLLKPLKSLIDSGLPVWGTCAGMILLAKNIEGEQPHLACMDITVKRNAYGKQADSFATTKVISKISRAPIPLVFIRAPWVSETKGDILLSLDGHIAMVEQNNMLATSFHPELTDDLSILKYFLKKVKR